MNTEVGNYVNAQMPMLWYMAVSLLVREDEEYNANVNDYSEYWPYWKSLSEGSGAYLLVLYYWHCGMAASKYKTPGRDWGY